MYLGDLTPLHFAAFTGAYEIQTYRKNRVSTEFIKYVLVRCKFASRNIMNVLFLWDSLTGNEIISVCTSRLKILLVVFVYNCGTSSKHPIHGCQTT